MTIQIPTSEAVPAGLPDELSLAQLAGEFFAALPGNPLDELRNRATPPRAAEPAIVLGSGSPTLAPATPPSEAPAGVGVPRSSSATPGVPEGYAAALPGVPAPSAPAASSPFYFLDQGNGYPTGDVAVPGAITAQPSGFPGDAALRALLAEIDHRAPAQQQGGNGSHFYFLDHLAAQPATPQAGAPQTPSAAGFDVNLVRRDFPILQERVNGKQLVWFDNAATTHKPQSVIDRLAYFYAHENSNIHRAAHALAARATDAYEAARQKVTKFLGAASPDEIIFVRGATEAINLVAKSWGAANIGAGDEIIVSNLEHHANIVPWQQLAAEKGAKIRVIPVNDSGQLLLDEYRKLLNSRTKLVAVTQVSNALGTITPVEQIVALAHSVGAKALVDGAQAVSHLRVNVQAMDADFYVFSGHKVFGPTGIGVVYGKKAILDNMPPWQGGGNMIADVTFERTVYHGAPARFEAGTGNIADAVGLGAAIDYVEQLGLDNIAAYEHALLEYATHYLRTIPGLRLIGTAAHKASVASFVLQGYKTEEVGHALNEEGIAVRSGHHCAQPILRRFGVEATVRPSLAFYNTCEEVDRMIAVLRQLTRR
ncbi:cysteine desulfurase / selenocysteine lyase [Andreprevotia lacus DSM 23236]|jgi:cysteine desulfurase/selenocysteine lyase|uniref:cysteine desulfurase n=1 Tax=Andreprevotia lacus DSM 23236 TaxID=1121001 RepID=A0A1W1XV36_9NEIS|nr:family 2A encapsulin nanocompartment cargo protein cysteine desulfurase [Andreprevotia lacus]SMC27766.1 cysteine desulfurase / selenocysteine lyase [Andreprevotia lacus DSM 23236]